MAAGIAQGACPDVCLGAGSNQQVSEAIGEILLASRVRITEWAKERVQAARLDTQRGRFEARNGLAQLDDRRAELEECGHLAEDFGELEREVNEIEREISASRAAEAERSATAARARDELDAMHQTRWQELQQEQDEVASRTAAHGDRRAEIDGFLGVYQERLGLRLMHAGPRAFRIVYTGLDPGNMARECSLTLGLPGTNGAPSTSEPFYAGDCDPPLPEMPLLLGALNQAPRQRGSLPKFFCAVRRAFQRQCLVDAATGLI